MNTKTLILSTTSSSYNKVMDTVILNDATVLNISLGDVYEDVLPISLQINWGDNNILYYDNDLYKVYRKESIIPEVIYGKFSKILQDTYSFEYYPSKTATYKKMTAQFLIKYTNKDTTLITIPIEIRSADYFESVYDMKMISTHILPEDGFKTHKFLTNKGNYVVEVESPMSENIIISEDIDISENLNILNGLISFWKLDETSGTRIDSKNGFDLTDNGSVGSNTGIINNSALLDGTNYLTYLANGGPQITFESMTVSVWVYLNSNTTEIGFVGTDANSALAIIDQHVYFAPAAGIPNHSFEDAGFVPANQWVHVVGRWNNATGQWDVFIDGVNTATHTHDSIAPFTVSNLIVGGILRDGYNPDNFVNGKMDESGIWNRALTDAEIVALYNNGSGLPYEQF